MKFPGSIRPAHRGFSLVEVLVALVILVGVALPSYVLYVQSRGAVFKSRLAILSTLAAQDEIEDLRLLARAAGAEIPGLAHDWQSVGERQNALALLTGQAGGSFDLTLDSSQPEKLKYPDEYKRIWTKVEVGEPVNGIVYPSVLHVQWQEKGERLGASDVQKRTGFSRFDFQLVRPVRGL